MNEFQEQLNLFAAQERWLNRELRKLFRSKFVCAKKFREIMVRAQQLGREYQQFLQRHELA